MALTDSIISYWKFDESSGDASDSAGSYPLTNTNTVGYATGLINNGADFGSSNTNKYLSVAFIDPDSYNSGLSFSFWFKLNATPNESTVFGFADGGWGGVYCSVRSTTAIAFRFGNGVTSDGGGSEITVPTMTTGVWYHVAMTHDTSANKYYFNGVYQTQKTTNLTLAANGSTINIGRAANGTGYASMVVDEFGVWGRALTADDVSKIYNSARGNQYSFTETPSLYGGVAYWKLDESGTTAPVDSIGTNTGVLGAGAGYATGKINNGSTGTASNSYIRTSQAITYGSAYSIACWYKSSYTGGEYNYLVTLNSAATGGTQYGELRQSASGESPVPYSLAFQISGTSLKSTAAYNDGNWHHVVLTMDGTNAVLYVDGASNNSTSSFSSSLSNNFYLKMRTSASEGGTNFLRGEQDEVGYWNRALTASEVTSLYNGGAGLQYPFTTSSINSGFFNFF